MHEDEVPSKSQRKREMHALRDLGARIAEMPSAQRDSLPLSPKLREALAEFDRLRAREARRRHLSFLGKLMRTEDIEAISARLADLDASSAAHVRRHHELEDWRTRLIDDEEAIGDFLARYPRCDRPRLRQLVRDCRTSIETERGRRSYRELFRLLRDTCDDDPDADTIPG